MRNNLSVGESSITPFKQDDIQNLLAKQIGNSYGVWRKCKNESYYKNPIQNCFIDCTAGNMDLTKKTSPLTFITTLRKFHDFPSKLFLIEKNKETFFQLSNNFHHLNEISGYYVNYLPFNDNEGQKYTHRLPPEIELLQINMCDALEHIPPSKYRYGLVYYDPNGFTLDDYLALFKFLHNNPRMDVILNINTTQIKRNRSVKSVCGFEKYQGIDLMTVAKKLSELKQYLYIRNNTIIEMFFNPCNKNQWVLMFGTNNKNFVMPTSYNFVPVHSKEGIEIISKYNNTKDESTN